jgi:hypothetical protein
MDTDRLIIIKDTIEKLSKIHQIEILRIFNKYNNVTLNENKNGIFINLTDVNSNVIKCIETYLQYVSKQELTLNEAEVKKGDYITTFFTDSNTESGISTSIPEGISTSIPEGIPEGITEELTLENIKKDIKKDINSDITRNINKKDNKEIELNN